MDVGRLAPVVGAMFRVSILMYRATLLVLVQTKIMSRNMHAGLSCGNRSSKFGISLHPSPYFGYARSEASDETVRMRRVV